MANFGLDNRSQQRLVDDVEQIIDRGRARPILRRSVANLLAVYDPKTQSAQITFTIAGIENIQSFAVLRNISRDPGSAKVIGTVLRESVEAQGDGLTGFTYSDADPAIVGTTAYYWVRVIAEVDPEDDSQLVGPQALAIPVNGDLGAPNQPLLFDAWKSAGAGGVVTIAVQVEPADDKTASIKIYISNYEGVAAYVAIAQSAQWPFRFTLLQTGEAITLKAIAVTQNGDEAASGPTKNLTLNGAATVPAQVELTDIAELTTGVQVGWVGGLETDLTTGYQIWRGPRSGGFGAASNIGTVAASGASHYTFLDTTGLTGQFEWYIVAVNAAGSSAASPAIWTGQASLTSADQTPNCPNNNTNKASLDSIDAGASATIRVYGAAGGVGTAWERDVGYGTESYASASLTGFAYTTSYYVVYDKQAAIYRVFTTLAQTVNDFYVMVGTTKTCAAGGAGGVGGGGGTDGGGGGGRGGSFPPNLP